MRKRKLPVGVVVKNGRWYVRIRYRGDDGKRHAAWRECEKNATDAKDVRTALQRELEERGPESIQHARSTFAELAEYFEEHHLQPAVFVDGRKVSGRRSVKSAKSALVALRAVFDPKPLRTITHGSLASYKRMRLTTPIVFKRKDSKAGKTITTKRQRTIATVQHELRLARRMFNVAIQEGWLLRNPFTRGDSLVSAADEKKRERILTPAEERNLLTLCVDRYAHLRPLIICAVDTGMRWGEMTKTRVGDLNFETGVISIEATHTKTLTKRKVKMTPRVARELAALCEGKQPSNRIFQITTAKKAWNTVRHKAGLDDVRWHDLRHTNATRIEKSKRVSIGQLGRHLGHRDLRSTDRYVNQDEDAVIEIAAALAEATAQVERHDDSERVN